MTVSEAKRLCNMKAWNEMATSQQESGLSVRQWCLQNGVPESTFNTRLRKLRKYTLENMYGPLPLAESKERNSPVPTINLAKVNIQSANAASNDGDIIIHKNGADIKICQYVSPELIKGIISEVLHA